jgi:hypothetical protein
MRPPAEPQAPRRETRQGRGLTGDPIRSGRDALMASLERPLSPNEPGVPAELGRPPARSAAGAGRGSAFDDDPDTPKEVPAVPSLAVLRPRRTGGASVTGPVDPSGVEKPARKRAPSWDDVLFGTAPARESS